MCNFIQILIKKATHNKEKTLVYNNHFNQRIIENFYSFPHLHREVIEYWLMKRTRKLRCLNCYYKKRICNIINSLVVCFCLQQYMCFVLHLCKKTSATTADVENECLYLNMLVKPDKYIITHRLEERTSFCSHHRFFYLISVLIR